MSPPYCDSSETWLSPTKLMSPLLSPGGLGTNRDPPPSPTAERQRGPCGSGGSLSLTAGPPGAVPAPRARPCHNKGKHLRMGTAGGSSRQHCRRICTRIPAFRLKNTAGPAHPRAPRAPGASPGDTRGDTGTAAPGSSGGAGCGAGGVRGEGGDKGTPPRATLGGVTPTGVTSRPQGGHWDAKLVPLEEPVMPPPVPSASPSTAQPPGRGGDRSRWHPGPRAVLGGGCCDIHLHLRPELGSGPASALPCHKKGSVTHPRGLGDIPGALVTSLGPWCHLRGHLWVPERLRGPFAGSGSGCEEIFWDG